MTNGKRKVLCDFFVQLKRHVQQKNALGPDKSLGDAGEVVCLNRRKQSRWRQTSATRISSYHSWA